MSLASRLHQKHMNTVALIVQSACPRYETGQLGPIAAQVFLDIKHAADNHIIDYDVAKKLALQLNNTLSDEDANTVLTNLRLVEEFGFEDALPYLREV